jgi:hypothetical protein
LLRHAINGEEAAELDDKPQEVKKTAAADRLRDAASSRGQD